MTPQLLATAKVHWLDSAHGGRKAPPSGSIYAATGRFADQGDELFSVILSFPSKETSQMQPSSGSMHSLVLQQVEKKSVYGTVEVAELGFLASEWVKNKLAPGMKLLITEGPRIVAECEIQSIILR